MFKISMEAKLFSDLLKAINAISDEAVFEITPDGVKAAGIEPTYIALVALELSKERLAECECSATGAKFAVHIPKFRKKLGHLRSGDLLTLEYGGETEFKARIENLVNGGARSFAFCMPETLRVLRIPQMPRVEFAAKVEIDASAFKSIMRFFRHFADFVKITVDPETITFSARKNNDEAQMVFHKDGRIALNIEAGKEVTAYYDPKYLARIARANPMMSTEIELELSSANRLMKLSIPMHLGKLEYFIAEKLVR
ncbi:MAG: hypothetical protein QW692_00165 [Nitrososphaerota archaeon]